MDPADPVQCNTGPGIDNGIPYDEQCYRIRYGNGGACRTPDDMAGDDAVRSRDDRACEDHPDPVRSPGCDYTAYI